MLGVPGRRGVHHGGYAGQVPWWVGSTPRRYPPSPAYPGGLSSQHDSLFSHTRKASLPSRIPLFSHTQRGLSSQQDSLITCTHRKATRYGTPLYTHREAYRGCTHLQTPLGRHIRRCHTWVYTTRVCREVTPGYIPPGYIRRLSHLGIPQGGVYTRVCLPWVYLRGCIYQGMPPRTPGWCIYTRLCLPGP